MNLGLLLHQEPALWWGLATLSGIVVGSFLNVLVTRLPKALMWQWQHAHEAHPPQPPFNVLWPRSFCPHCEHPIAIWDNIPILSYFVLRGRCRYCHHAIARRYIVSECLTPLLSLIVAYHFGFSMAGLLALVLTWGLLALSFIDFETQLLPDELTLPLLWLGLLASVWHVYVGSHTAIIGAAAGYISLWLVYWAFKLIRGKEGMGYGDFKLFAVGGAWLGWQALPITMLIAAGTGAMIGLIQVYRKRHDIAAPMPFGPFIALGIWISFVFQPQLVF